MDSHAMATGSTYGWRASRCAWYGRTHDAASFSARCSTDIMCPTVDLTYLLRMLKMCRVNCVASMHVDMQKVESLLQAFRDEIRACVGALERLGKHMAPVPCVMTGVLEPSCTYVRVCTWYTCFCVMYDYMYLCIVRACIGVSVYVSACASLHAYACVHVRE
jgi:hypothetical protein